MYLLTITYMENKQPIPKDLLDFEEEFNRINNSVDTEYYDMIKSLTDIANIDIYKINKKDVLIKPIGYCMLLNHEPIFHQEYQKPMPIICKR